MVGAGPPSTPFAGISAVRRGCRACARHDVMATTVPPAHYFNAYAARPGHDDVGTPPVIGQATDFRLFPRCVHPVGRVPAIHPPTVEAQMAATRPAMTERERPDRQIFLQARLILIRHPDARGVF